MTNIRLIFFWGLIFIQCILIVSCATTSTEVLEGNVNISKAESDLREDIVSTALSLKGVNYKYGGKTPKTGFDCSGLTYYVMRKNGIKLSGPSYHQAKYGRKIPLDKAKSGDLIFFSDKGKINHVGIVVENKRDKLEVIHSTSSSGVKIDNVLKNTYWNKRIAYSRDIIN